jgi:hypothetical protein
MSDARVLGIGQWVLGIGQWVLGNGHWMLASVVSVTIVVK